MLAHNTSVRNSSHAKPSKSACLADKRSPHNQRILQPLLSFPGPVYKLAKEELQANKSAPTQKALEPILFVTNTVWCGFAKLFALWVFIGIWYIFLTSRQYLRPSTSMHTFQELLRSFSSVNEPCVCKSWETKWLSASTCRAGSYKGLPIDKWLNT